MRGEYLTFKSNGLWNKLLLIFIRILVLNGMVLIISGCCDPIYVLDKLYNGPPLACVPLIANKSVYELTFTPSGNHAYDFRLHNFNPDDAMGLNNRGYTKNLAILKCRVVIWKGSDIIAINVAESAKNRQFMSMSSFMPMSSTEQPYGEHCFCMIMTIKNDPYVADGWIKGGPLLRGGETYRAVVTIEGLPLYLKTFGRANLVISPY